MTDTQAPAGAEIEVAETINPELARQFAEMAIMVPAEKEGGADNILAAILAAKSWEHLADPWESTNAAALAGRRLLIRSIMRRPSDFRDGLGLFLVVDSVDPATGEPVVWTTSSVSVVAQLVRAYALRQLPQYAEVIVASRPTEAGYRPQHLKFYGPPP